MSSIESSQIFPEFAGTRRFTVEEYHTLGEAGILGPEDRVELLDGYILYKADYPELRPTETRFPAWRDLRRWSLTEYQRMLDLGIIRPEEQLEFLDGYLALSVPPTGPNQPPDLPSSNSEASDLPGYHLTILSAQ